MKRGIIPGSDNVRFKIGDVVEIGWDNVFGVITNIEDTVLDIRGYYCLYLNGENTYYRSSDVLKWYRKNRKGVLVMYYDQDVADRLYYEKHKNDPLSPGIKAICDSLEKLFTAVDLETGEVVELKKLEVNGLPDYTRKEK